MLQKYFPIVGEVNSPLAMMAALQFSASAAKLGISNDTLEGLLWAEVENTPAHRKEVEVAASELEAARKAAIKESRALRYRAAMAARSARAASKLSRQVKAAKTKASLRELSRLSGLSIEVCRVNAANTQKAVLTATHIYSSAAERVSTAIEGGDVRSIRSSVAALKEAVRLLEVRHLEFRFAREMLSISLVRHSA